MKKTKDLNLTILLRMSLSEEEKMASNFFKNKNFIWIKLVEAMNEIMNYICKYL